MDGCVIQLMGVTLDGFFDICVIVWTVVRMEVWFVECVIGLMHERIGG